MALKDDYNQGIIKKSTYIRMCITTPRHQLGDSYEIGLPLQGVSESDVFTEAASLILNEFVNISLGSFTITWLQPELLPSYSPDAVRSMKVGGQGYLYFALGADNLAKTQTQLVEPGRLNGFYGMTNAEILAELGRLTGAKTCTTNITQLAIGWLNKSAPAAREFDSIAAVVTQLRKEIAEAIAKIPTPPPGATVDHTHPVSQIEQLTAELDNLAEEINDRQLKGNYALISEVNSIVAELRTALEARQPVGEYVLAEAMQTALNNLTRGIDAKANAEDLDEAIATLVNQISEKAPLLHEQPIDSIIGLQNTLTQIIQAIETRAPAGNYALQSALLNAIANFSRELDTKQPRGNYQPAGNYQAAGDYAPLLHNHTIAAITGLQTALDNKQPIGNYALQQALTDAIASLQTAINGKQPAGDYPLRSEIISSPKVSRSLYTKNSPANPSIGDVWEAYNGDGDGFDTERWTYNGSYWVSQRRLVNWSLNAISAASNFFELLDKYPNKHGVLFEWFVIGMKAGASNSPSAYATFTLSKKDSLGVSTALSSFNTSAIAANGRIYTMKDIKQSFPNEAALDAVIALTLTGAPGAMSGSVGFSYRYTW